jgi:hypothetical protein
LALAIAALAGGLGAPDQAQASFRVCGEIERFHHTLELRQRGDVLPCGRAHRIARGPCEQFERWSCFSFRAPGPLLVWFREKEQFSGPKTLIFARRYPCDEASVTAEEWARSRASQSERFPSLTQVLADDMMRCDQLTGMTAGEVITLLGEPDTESSAEGRTYLDYVIGLQRDSFFQIDSENLSVVVGPDGLVRRVRMYST